MESKTQGWSLFHRYEPMYSKPMGVEEANHFHPDGKTVWFLFREDRMLVKSEPFPEMDHGKAMGDEIGAIGIFPVGSVGLPAGGRVVDWTNGAVSVHSLGLFEGHLSYAVLVSDDKEADLRADGFIWEDLRTLLPLMDGDAGFLAGRALQTLNWQRNNRFCGRCGSEMSAMEEERSMKCPDCGYRQYPRLSPAIIVAVTRGDELLLAHANHFPGGLYSLVAGFVEPGETFEDCVAREVREEVGIGIRKIRYLSSQPWPFPDSLMVGFTAEWAEDEICADGVEIGEAHWFARDGMPDIPGQHTIAGRIIRRWLLATL